MNKQILEEYIDACELIEETKKDIQKLNQKKKTIIQTNVSGSNPNFPYQPQHFKIEGMTITVKEDARLRYEEKLLEERIKKAEDIKFKVQQFLNTTSPRMQRIIRMRYFEGKTWREIANKIGKKATENSVRMEVERFLKEN